MFLLPGNTGERWTIVLLAGHLVSRTFYARGQTGQQLLLGAYQALSRQIKKGNVEMYPRMEMYNLVLVDGKARGIIGRDVVTGKLERFSAHAVVLASGGYGNVFFLSTMAMGANASAAWQCHKKGALFGKSLFCPDPSYLHPGTWGLSVETDPHE